MIFDSHMHVGSFDSMFGVSLDRDGIDTLMREHGIGHGVVFHPDNAYVRDVVETIPGLYGLVWSNPRMPGYLEEAEEFLGHPKFLGMKMHPLIDGFHPNDPSVHPLIELLVERDLPVLIHCGHPIFTLPWSLEELAVSFPAANCTRASFRYAGRNKLPTTSLRNIWASSRSQPIQSGPANGPEYSTGLRRAARLAGVLHPRLGKRRRGSCLKEITRPGRRRSRRATTFQILVTESMNWHRTIFLLYDLTATRRPQAERGMTGLLGYKKLELGV